MLCSELEIFSELMMIHERKIADFLEISTVKEKFFSDCPSFVKSLGAWGGDFVMVISPENPEQYFKDKGFDVLLHYDELILH